jgi:uncharacterized protein YjlB
MPMIPLKKELRTYTLRDNGKFPNSHLPVLHYLNHISLPWLFKGTKVKQLFRNNGWTNNWRAGIYTYAHYHSNTHEALAVIHGSTSLQLGGEDGITVRISAGDVLVIPAGVAHQNMGKENDVVCIAGYPQGAAYNMCYGKPEERPDADLAIGKIPAPESDPLHGERGELIQVWSKSGLRKTGTH